MNENANVPPTAENAEPLNRPPQTEVRFLTPDMCTIHLGTFGALHVTVKNEAIYGGVYAAYAFPVAHSNEYISLLQRMPEGEDQEVGVIRNLDEFPPEQADLVRHALARRYFIHTIIRIDEVGMKYGFLSFEVETDKGKVDFLMKWQGDRAVDYGDRGKVLIDVNGNRYLIPDLDKLSPKERNDFTRYIYW
ncbi:MAG TPA: DUF1854 domain-containing protein [Planctomycetota bacterium]|nr:DUF1854 domain-containing protein [Planctomycetota bacterium]